MSEESGEQRRALPRPPPQPRSNGQWSWHGAVALTLAVTVGGGYAAVLIILALRGQDSSGAGGLLHYLGAVIAGSLAGWLGGSAVANDHRQRRERDRDLDNRPDI